MAHTLPNRRAPADPSPPEGPVSRPARLVGLCPNCASALRVLHPPGGAHCPREPVPQHFARALGESLSLAPGEAFAGFSLLCEIRIKGPCCILYMEVTSIPPPIDWTRRVIPVSDLPLITETIILRIHRLTFPCD